MNRIVFATLVALGTVGVASAQQSGSKAPRGNDRTNQVSFEKADKNGDGKVNREEGNSIAGFDFSRADTNNDGSLTRQEFQAAMARSTPRGDGKPGPLAGDRTEQVSFKKADKNGDGIVDRSEAADIKGFDFSRADVDDDAKLTRREYQAAMRDSHPRG